MQLIKFYLDRIEFYLCLIGVLYRWRLVSVDTAFSLRRPHSTPQGPNHAFCKAICIKLKLIAEISRKQLIFYLFYTIILLYVHLFYCKSIKEIVVNRNII